jgi:hypothetical protein
MSMASNYQSIVFFSKDYGGVLAFLPIIKKIQEDGELLNVVVVAHKSSYELYKKEDIKAIVIPSYYNQNKIEQFLDNIIDINKPKIIVTGTSRKAKNEIRTLEQILIKKARNTDIKTISILDFWGFYEERFPCINGQVIHDYIPDVICCLDEKCKEDLLALGVPHANLKITHNPHIDSLDASVKKIHKNVNEFNVLYVSQPIREQDLTGSLGFDQESNFMQLLKTFVEGYCWFNKYVNIYLWVHPKESIISWESIVNEKNKEFVKMGHSIKIIYDVHKSYALFNKLDLACSYYSTVLYDALYFRIPCLSLGIGSKVDISSLLVTNKLGLTETILSEKDLNKYINESDFKVLIEKLNKTILNYSKKKIFFSDGSATKKVIKIINNFQK